MMDWIGLRGFVRLNRRSSIKSLATVAKLEYPCSSMSHSSLCTAASPPQDDAAFQTLTAFGIVHPDLVSPSDPCLA